MKEQFPPVALPDPAVGNRRVPKRKISPATPAAREQRLQRLNFTLGLVADVKSRAGKLSHEERKAMFFRIRHDRPLTPKDLRSTGFAFMGTPGAEESLLIPKKDDALDRLELRMKEYAATDDPTSVQRSANLVEATREITLGKAEDRFSEAFHESYAKLQELDFCVVEIEITSFAQTARSRKRELLETVQELKRCLGVSSGNIYDVDYEGSSAMLVLWCTGRMLGQLVQDLKWRRRITLFDLRPEFKTMHESYRDFNIDDVTIEPPAEDAETICVIDTGVAAGNPFLSKVIRRDLSQSYIPGFEATVDEVGHGSGVASLAAFHSIEYTEGGVNRARAWIASARITDDEGALDVITKNDNGQYWVQGGKLLSNILRNVVADMVRYGVRIFVFSFFLDRIWCNASKRIVPRNLWLARTVDRLCREYSIVFVTITGNILAGDVEALHGAAAYPAYFSSPAAKLCDPAHAALAVTVGSIAHSARVISATHGPFVLTGLPSPFTRSGPGFGDAIKPDFVERGGNLAFDILTGCVSNTHLSTNVVVASGELSPALSHAWGTSFAAPRVAFHAAVIAHDLRRIGVNPSGELLRAFLALSAAVDSEMVVSEDDLFNRTLHGYGLPDGERATDCDYHAITTYFDGTVEAGRVLLFQVHVPAELADFGRGEKCITVCAAIAPPVQQIGIEEYLGADMEFRLFRGDAPQDEVVALMCELAAEDTAVQQRGELSKALAKFDISGAPKLTSRSVGTLQKATFVWHDHKDGFSDNDYLLAISLRPASWWKEDDRSLRLGCAVRLEDRTTRCAEVYARVSTRVNAKIQAQQRTG